MIDNQNPPFDDAGREPDGRIAWGRELMAFWLPDGVTADAIGVAAIAAPEPEACEVPF